MFKIINWLKNNKLSFIKGLVFVIVIVTFISNIEGVSAANTNHTIKFWQAWAGYEIAECKTGADGRVSSSCASCIKSVCNRWSLVKYGTGTQTNDLYGSKIATTVFNKNANYYCVSGSSYNDTWDYSCDIADACFVCSTDSNVMKWSKDGSSDSACSAGYIETNTPKSSCVTKTSCYVCKDNNNVMKWSTNGKSDSACEAGYTEDTSIEQSSCKTKTPACYVCKNNSNVMKWGYTGESDDSCTSGYTEDTSINETECQTIPDVEIEVDNTSSSKSIITIILATILSVIGVGLIYKIRKKL